MNYGIKSKLMDPYVSVTNYILSIALQGGIDNIDVVSALKDIFTRFDRDGFITVESVHRILMEYIYAEEFKFNTSSLLVDNYNNDIYGWVK